ncbi:MAG: winged helix-turn-helix domain-containing protein [Pseudomonadota bacterium]
MERKLTTIVAMDVVGYSKLMAADEEGTLRRLKEIRTEIVDPEIERRGGRTVKLMGDGTLAEFASVVGALQCAVDIQKGLEERNRSLNGAGTVQLRIGLHLGDVIVDGDDIYGDGVNLASRLEGIAEPGGIVLSKQVHDQIGSNVPVGLVPLAPQRLKNFDRPVEAFRVSFDEKPAGAGVVRFGTFELDTGLFELREAGAQVAVEPRVFDLLVFLAGNPDRTVTKEEVIAEIWGDRIVSDAALSTLVKAARKVLGDDGTSQHTIRTVHGRGFRFVAEIESVAPAQALQPDPEPEPSASSNGARPSVAVLPLANLNSDPTEDYFADGVTEDATIALAKNRWLNVIDRNSAFSFRNSSDGIRVIGQKLGATYLVTGSVRKAGSRARIAIQLVDAETEASVWSERFDRDMVDIFDLQDDISETIAARIEAELGLTEQRKAERRPRKNLGAWDLYQLGVSQFYKFTPEANEKCQELLREAISLDPDLASAHSRLAYAITLSMVYFDVEPDQERLDEALAAAKRAIALDDQDAHGYFTIGRVHLARCEYDLAIDALEHAVQLNPCLAVGYCGLGDSLAYEGRLDEAISQFETAIRLSPHDPFRWAFYSYRSLAHLFRGDFEDAVAWARRSAQIPNAQYWARAHLVSALGHLGDQSQIDGAVRDLLKVKPEFCQDFAREHLFYLKRLDQIETYVEGLKKAGVD